MQNGAVNEAWCSIENEEEPWKCQLTTLYFGYQSFMQYSCCAFVLVEVIIFAANQTQCVIGFAHIQFAEPNLNREYKVMPWQSRDQVFLSKFRRSVRNKLLVKFSWFVVASDVGRAQRGLYRSCDLVAGGREDFDTKLQLRRRSGVTRREAVPLPMLELHIVAGSHVKNDDSSHRRRSDLDAIPHNSHGYGY